MRHRLSRRGLGRKSSHRQALIRNQITELLRHDRIVTTEAKAKSVRPEAEKVITLGKRGTLHARRRAGAVLTDTAILTKLFDEIAPRFETRPGGYTRITKLGPRQGDGARMAMLELVVGSAVAGPTNAGAAAVAEPEAAVEDEQEDAVDETAEDEVPADDATDDATDGGADDEAESDEPSAELSDEADASDDASADEADASDDATDDSTDDAETDEEES